MPSASRSAVSTESVSRCFAVAFTDSRSTTTEMSCLSCFLSVGGAVSGCTVPSTSTREYPCPCSSVKRSTNSPFRVRTTGASTWNRVPSSSASTWSTIC